MRIPRSPPRWSHVPAAAGRCRDQRGRDRDQHARHHGLRCAPGGRLVGGRRADRPAAPARRLEAALACDRSAALPVLERRRRGSRGRPRAWPRRGAGDGAQAQGETSGLLAEALSAAEIQHGPKAVIGPGRPVLVHGLGDPGGQDATAFGASSRASGAEVLLAGGAARCIGADPLPLPAPLHPARPGSWRCRRSIRWPRLLARPPWLRSRLRPPGLRKVTATV